MNYQVKRTSKLHYPTFCVVKISYLAAIVHCFIVLPLNTKYVIKSKMKKQNYVYHFRWAEQTFWLKKRGEDKRNLLNRTLSGLARLNKRFRKLALHSADTPEQRFLHEVKAYQYAMAHQLPVARLRYVNKSWFITEDGGSPINKTDANSPKLLFRRAMCALNEMHQKNFIHGRPAMRDILVNQNGKVTFVDLEEAQISNDPARKVRDVVLFLLDSYRLHSVSQQTRIRAVEAWIAESNESVRAEFKRVSRKLNRYIWLAHTVLLFKPNRLSKQLVLLARFLACIDLN
ncbi:hypothetical protein ABDK09_02565 [Vibrio sp. CDRSL-10 TSBA]